VRQGSTSRIVGWATTMVLVLTGAGVLLNSTGLLAGEVAGSAKVRLAAGLLPTLFYLAAIGMVQRAHAAIVRGEAVEATLARLLERLGICLLLGGLARVFGEIWIVRLIAGGVSSVAWFDVAAITLGCVGLLLVLLARPLRAAGQARAELADIL
jgi:hypothetical protein